MKRICIIIVFITGASYADIIIQPYLQAVTNNSVYVLVECNTRDTVTVHYGLSTNYGSTFRTESIDSTTASPVTYIHNVKLSGLQENTIYYYKALQGSTQSSGYSFITALPPGLPFTFSWMCDQHVGTAVHGQIAQLIRNYNTRFSLYGGDLCDNTTYQSWKTEFFIPNELQLISQVPFFNATGNHEGWNQNTMAFTQAPQSASGTQAYYSFDYADMHVLVLNTELPLTVGSQQYIFAQSDLSASNRIWKIVTAHKPGYCGGGAGEYNEMKVISQNVFVPNHVDMVISGHSHFYQHNYVSGIHHMIIASSGAPLANPVNASYTIKSVKDYSFGIFSITESRLNLKVYNNLNVLLDSFSINKTVGIKKISSEVPSGFKLYQNYPNPFNPKTKIKFDIPVPPSIFGEGQGVWLIIYNTLGQEVTTLVNEQLKPGTYEVEFDGSNFASGVYFYRVQSGYFNAIKKLVLVK
jgi:hypothetical protein